MSKNFITTRRDIECMNETMQKLYSISYQRLKDVQRDSVGLVRSSFNITELKYADYLNLPLLDTNCMLTHMLFTSINKTMIHYNKRDKYLKSEFFGKIIKYSDIVNNPDIFVYLPLFFIDGNICTNNISFILSEDTTHILIEDDKAIFPGADGLSITELLSKKVDCDILFVKNGGYMMEGDIPLRTLVFKENVLDVNSSHFKKRIEYGKVNTNNNLVTFTYSKTNSNNPIKYNSGINSVQTKTKNGSYQLKYLTNRNVPSGYADITMLHLPEVVEIITIPAGKKAFCTEEYDYPVPKENLIFFKRIETGEYVYTRDVNVETTELYPRLFMLDKPQEDDLRVLVLYSTECRDAKYIDYSRILWTYKSTDDILEMYENGSIHDTIKNYNPYEFKYIDEGRDPIIYDQDYRRQFTEAMKNNTEYLRDYIHCRLNKLYPFTEYVVNKTFRKHRRRMSSLDTPNNVIEFSEPHLVFMSMNDSKNKMYKSVQVFVNGILVKPDTVTNSRDSVCLYFKESRFNDNDIVTYESHYPVVIEERRKFSSLEDFLTLDFRTKNGLILKDNVFLVDQLTKEYISRDKYSLSIKDYENVWQTIKDESEVLINSKVKIQILDSELVNREILIMVNNECIFEESISDFDGCLTGIDALNPGNGDVLNRSKVFIRGRRVPRKFLRVGEGNKWNDTVRFMSNIKRNEGDSIHVHTVPSHYSLIHYEEIISEKGIVDLSGKISKPFDLRWFEVYLNGRRLNNKNVEYLSSLKFRIKDVSSLNDLEIYDTNLFMDNEWEIITDDTIKDIIVEELLPDILDKVPPIIDTEEDNCGSPSEWGEGEFDDFLDWLSNQFINPNIQQVEDWMKEAFAIIFWYNNSPDDIYLNPNHEFTSQG